MQTNVNYYSDSLGCKDCCANTNSLTYLRVWRCEHAAVNVCATRSHYLY